MSKAIVICCDGTGNLGERDAKLGTASNVWRFYDAVLGEAESAWQQTKWYDAGVGTETSSRSRRLSTIETILSWVGQDRPGGVVKALGVLRRIVELAVGIGITENITEGYTEIVRRYEPGDKIYLVGFSRGAYTARCIAGVISRAGLLRSEQVRFAADVVRLYCGRRKWETDVIVDPTRIHPKDKVEIEFLGVWDTVASLGLPLWGWWFRIGKLWNNVGRIVDTAPAKQCKNVFHALSLDERRSQFFPTLFDEKLTDGTVGPRSRIEQVWFRGTHSGVGGGYLDSGLSDISLRWMLDKAAECGLWISPEKVARIAPNPLGGIEDQMEHQRAWTLFGSWPRWHPCDDGAVGSSAGFGVLHSSVTERARHAASTRTRPDMPTSRDDLVRLNPNETVTIRVRADRAWNNTGVVVEPGHKYQMALATQPSSWQRKDRLSVGAGGEPQAGLPASWLRWMFRKPEARAMELVIHIAWPRRWPLAEKSASQLLRYLLIQDPPELTSQLDHLGKSLGNGGQGSQLIEIAPEKSAGVLHCFANDSWLAYPRNSGSVHLTITRVA
jgi:uncharacterized protein (DUF2235 family)